MSVRLDWDGKPRKVERLALPFQTVETINESRATRERDRGSLFGGDPVVGKTRNLLIWGDNKLVMSSLLKEYAGEIKLVYIDPPFATGDDFTVKVQVGEEDLVKEPSILEEHAYRDTWGAGFDSYLSMMYERLSLIHDLLADDGSLFLHLAPNVSHPLRLVCDEIFGEGAFRNEIIWKRTSGHSRLRRYGPVHDAILYYSKSDEPTWNPQYVPYDDDYVEAFYRHVEDETGRRYQLGDLTSARPGGRFLFNGQPPPGNRYWGYAEETMQRFEDEGRIVYSKHGVPRYKRYLDEMPGQLIQDVWADISGVASQSGERAGYATQKPVALAERILAGSSDEGDLVADFFVGSGTTLRFSIWFRRGRPSVPWSGPDREFTPTGTDTSRSSISARCRRGSGGLTDHAEPPRALVDQGGARCRAALLQAHDRTDPSASDAGRRSEPLPAERG